MEPQSERRKTDRGPTDAGGRVSPNVAHLQPQTNSSEFRGTGVANNNGNFHVGRDLYVTTGSTFTTTEELAAERRKKLLKSLRFDQIDSRQLSIKRAHAKTCRWILENSMYKQWETQATSHCGGKNFLWIRGKPGAGKSTLMNYLHGEVQSQLGREEAPQKLISFFFNAQGSDLEKSTIGMYRSLLLQLLEKCPDMQHVLDQTRTGFQDDINILKNLFERVAEKTTTTCLIDALDECEVADIRKMVSWFDDITEAGIQISICFASRHYPHIRIRTRLSVILENQDEHENDISSYLDTKLDIGRSRQSEQIRQEIREKASGVFMWVVLVVEILNIEYGKGKIPKLRERLKQIPGDLHQLFHSILVRDDEDQDELLLCIQWVLFAKELLTLNQLYLATNSGSIPQDLADCHSGEITADDMKRYVVGSSKGLANTTRLGGRHSTIHFIHESVRDFLLKGDGMSRVFPNLATNISGFSHEALGKCCRTYIQMYHEIGRHKYHLTEFAFLKYATEGALYHTNQAEGMGVSQREPMGEFPHAAWVRCNNIFQEHERRRYTQNVTMLYILAQTGMASLIQALPHIQSCFEAEEECYGLPIIAAEVAENYDCVQEMLRIQAKRFPGFSFAEFCRSLPANIASSHTPSKHVAQFYDTRTDHPIFTQVVQLGGEFASLFYLETEGYDAESEESGGIYTLFSAVECKYVHLLKELHHRGASMAAATDDGFSLLHCAVVEGEPIVIRQLLDCGADVSAAYKDRTTPLELLLSLHQRTESKFLDCARLLVDHGANLSVVDPEGRTPLHTATLLRGSLELVKLLLERGASVTAVDTIGQTPLHLAASEWSGFDICQVLLRYGADIEAVDQDMRTPLHHSNTIETSRILLDHNALISAVDSNGLTPLHLASEEFKPGICQLLLRCGADIEAVDKRGRTPLHCSVSKDISQILLENKACVSATDVDGNTPLHVTASKWSGIGLSQLLLQYGADPTALNHKGQTPLDRAKSNGVTTRWFTPISKV